MIWLTNRLKGGCMCFISWSFAPPPPIPKTRWRRLWPYVLTSIGVAPEPGNGWFYRCPSFTSSLSTIRCRRPHWRWQCPWNILCIHFGWFSVCIVSSLWRWDLYGKEDHFDLAPTIEYLHLNSIKATECSEECIRDDSIVCNLPRVEHFHPKNVIIGWLVRRLVSS